MRELDQHIFEELISDTQFIAWAKGEDLTKAAYWDSWSKNHPLYQNEFREAVEVVKNLRFRVSEVNSADIHYLWLKTAERINQGKPSGKFRQFFLSATKVAAVLLLPVMVISGWLIYNQYHLAEKYSNLLADKHEQKVTVVAPIGARIMVDLPDGSMVWLNSGSEITYPIVFNTSERLVNLKGEAYFEVQKAETPFLVSNLGPQIKVYGTEFNVNSYADEDVVTVALAEGKVALDLNGNEEFLEPGQVSYFDRKKNKVTIERSDIQVFSCWREGKYIFRDTPLSAILRILQRQHNVNIQLLDKELGDYRYKATINNESLEQVLQFLSVSAPMKYKYKRKVLNPDGTYEPENVEISEDKTRIIRN